MYVSRVNVTLNNVEDKKDSKLSCPVQWKPYCLWAVGGDASPQHSSYTLYG